MDNRGAALTEAQMRSYRDDGYVVLRGVISPDTLAGLRADLAGVVDDLAQGWFDEGVLADLCEELAFERRWAAIREQVPAARPVTWRRVLITPRMHALWTEPALLSVMPSLLGDELWAHELFNGRPREPKAPLQTIQWHQDAFNCTDWAWEDGRILTVWIPLVAVDERAGCLAVIPGSHHWGPLDMDVDEYSLTRIADPRLRDEPGVPVPVEPGDAVLFTDLTLHRSLENVSDHVRWSVDIRFCPATAALRRKAAGGFLCHSARTPAEVESFEAWAAKWDPKTGVMRRQLRRLDLYASTLGGDERDLKVY